MPVKTEILDGKGKGILAEVGIQHQLYTAEIFPDLPEAGIRNRYKYFSALLGSTGFSSGTTNQNVDGSVTPQKFYGNAHIDYDIHIMGIAILIGDSAIIHNRFGNIAIGDVPNGWDLGFHEDGETIQLIEDARTGGQVIAQAGFRGGAGAGNDAATWEIMNWTGLEDAQYIYIPIAEYLPGGFRIGRGSSNKIISIVNDDFTGLTDFWQRVFGYRHYA